MADWHFCLSRAWSNSLDGIVVMSYGHYHKLLSRLIHLTNLQSGRCQIGRWGWVMLWGPNLRFTWSFGSIWCIFTEGFHYTRSVQGFPLCQTEHVEERSFLKGDMSHPSLLTWNDVIVNCPHLHNQQQYQRATPFTKRYGSPEGRDKKAVPPSIWNTRSIIHLNLCSRTWKQKRRDPPTNSRKI